jgi:hypothetical protein
MMRGGRRVARRTARRTSRRQMAMMQDSMAPEPQEPTYAAPPPPAAPAGAPDYAAELEQLAALKAQGILTEEEFQAKKKQILGL